MFWQKLCVFKTYFIWKTENKGRLAGLPPAGYPLRSLQQPGLRQGGARNPKLNLCLAHRWQAGILVVEALPHWLPGYIFKGIWISNAEAETWIRHSNMGYIYPKDWLNHWAVCLYRGILYPLVILQMAATSRRNQADARSVKLIQISHPCGRNQNTGAIICYLPRYALVGS